MYICSMSIMLALNLQEYSATELTFYESAGTAAAFLQKGIFSILTFKKNFLSIRNILWLTKHEYPLSIELYGSGFEAGLSTLQLLMLPAEGYIFPILVFENTFEHNINKCTK